MVLQFLDGNSFGIPPVQPWESAPGRSSINESFCQRAIASHLVFSGYLLACASRSPSAATTLSRSAGAG
jgi:hypothetical protein